MPALIDQPTTRRENKSITADTFLRTSSAFSSSTVYDYEAQTAHATSSLSQPPHRTFGIWPS
jgi:hypothetical protein